jgi:hypothetical protein
VLAVFVGWEVVSGGFKHRWFRRLRDARDWLNSDEGQAWLDSLPKETP